MPASSLAHSMTKTWWSPMELKTILDDDAEDIRKLRETVDLLMSENVELRREISILRTPSDAYYAAFVTPPPLSQHYSQSATEAAPLQSRSTLAADASLHQLAVLRCGAKVRATEDAIIQAGADAALYRHRCAVLEENQRDHHSREESLKATIHRLQELVVEKEHGLDEWKARQAAADALLLNEKHSVAGARAVVGELENIIRELRDALATERERCSILVMDNTMLSTAVAEGRLAPSRDAELQLTVHSLQQELREMKLKLDKSRVRCVELEMRIEKSEGHFVTDGGAAHGKNSQANETPL